MIRSFTDMEVWQKANELAIDVFKMTISLPRSEDYALTSQVRRSSNSVSGNIAEGYGRKTKNDKNYFYTIARASAFKTQSHLKYGIGVGYFTEEKLSSLFTGYEELIHQLNKIMKSLD